MTNTFRYEVEEYLSEHRQFFDEAQIKNVMSLVINSNKTMKEIKSLKLKSPTKATILSVCLGWMGADRFYSGDYILGFIKLLTAGIWFIGWFVDICVIGKRVKNKNFAQLYAFVTGEEVNKPAINVDAVKNIITNEEVRNAAKDLVKAHKDLTDTMDTDNNF